MEFTPHLLLKNPHIQTLYPTLKKQNPSLDFTKERFILSDEDFIEPYWYKKDPTKPIVVLLHGLGGSYKSPYIPQLMQNLSHSGFSPVLMHFRGALTPNDTPRSYHSGEIWDLREFLLSLKRYNQPIALVGFSLGANVTLKYLAAFQKDPLVEQAIAVSTPFKLEICAKKLNVGFAKIYQNHLLKDLKKMLLQKAKRFDIGLTQTQIQQIQNFVEFDELYTAPIHGFKNAKDYYEQSSSFFILDQIQTPTTLIHAKDDPFMTQEVLPKLENLSSAITPLFYSHGGHVGFVAGSWSNPSYFLDDTIPTLLHRRVW